MLIHHARLLVTMDDARREIEDGAVFVRDGVIGAVGPSAELPQAADEVIAVHDQVVIPGLVNTHHHMFQSLTRVIGPAQDCELFGWLRTLHPIWAGLTPEMVRVSTQTAMAVLLLSGCTTSSDQLYRYPKGVTLEDSIECAHQIGMRFHAARGSMSVGQSQGGLPPDSLVEDEAFILKDTQRLIESWHDPGRFAMQRIVVAPCSPLPGMAADIVTVPLDEIGMAGALRDPLAALFFCHVPRARLQGCQGLITAAPAASKGTVSRVARVKSLATAMAAM